MNLENVLIPEASGEKDIAVIPRNYLYNGEYWVGMREMEENNLFNLLSAHMEFHERTNELELDDSLKQIIPYFLVRKGDKYLTALRKNKTGDKRIHGARLIGFGGHLKASDIKGTMNDWLKREFAEEIFAEKVLDIRFISLLNDDDDPTGISKVHIGLVFEIAVDGNISILERDKFENEEFLSVPELVKRTSEMESWSALVAEFLVSRA